MSRVVHKLIAATAKELAGAFYEVAAGANTRFYRQYPSQRRFIQLQWHEFIGHARDSLVKMLDPISGTENDRDGPKYRYSEHIRDEVFEALVMDGTHKAAPALTVDQMRANAGFEPLSEVRKSRTGRIFH